MLAVALASCGGDDDEATERSPGDRTQVERTATERPRAIAPPRSGTATATTPDQPCRTEEGHTIQVFRRRLSCAEARAAVSGYDLQGPKVQDLGAFVCEGAEADVRPLLYTCVSDEAEIAVSEPSS